MNSNKLLPENIHPLTDFLRNHKRHLRQLKRSRQPTVLTLNGKAEVVVQDARAYQAMIDSLESTDARKGVSEGIASLERGEGEPAEAVFTRLRKKHGFTGERK